MNSFDYASPTDLETAIGLLGARFGEVEVLAGGTDLVTSLKQGITSPKRLVSLKAIPKLKGIETSHGSVHIGAMTPLADVLEHQGIGQGFPAITEAIQGIGSPQIIAMGTVGGDLCQRPRCWYYRQGFGLLGQLDGESLILKGDNRYHAIFGNEGPAYFVNASSLAPPLVALGATLEIVGPKGKSRQLAVAEFFRVPASADERETVLAANEVVTRISIPVLGLANATYEVRQRQGLDWPLVTASVAFSREVGDGGQTPARKAQIVLGHVAPKPWSVPGAAALLDGQAPDEALALRAAEAAANGAKPLSKNAYKVRLVKTAVKRAILAAAEQRERGPGPR
jgi:xanthine dehydrogenase YagS FAD-binding subunit